MAVNLSPHNLVDTTLPGRLAQLLERFGLAGSALELEITEDMAMADPARTAEVIKAINELGIGFSLDDFGTGYSSLAHLKYLNCNELKIDRSFVRDIASDEDDRVIVWSILDLARNLGMRTVAEGIESPEVVEMLSMMGCSVGQGFHYAKAARRRRVHPLVRRPAPPGNHPPAEPVRAGASRCARQRRQAQHAWPARPGRAVRGGPGAGALTALGQRIRPGRQRTATTADPLSDVGSGAAS